MPARFEMYEKRVRSDLYSRLKSKTFVIAAATENSLIAAVQPMKLTEVPGHRRASALIVDHSSGVRELWVNPSYKANSLIHRNFFEAIDVEVPATVRTSNASDHAFPKSATQDQVAYTLMNFIDRSVNSSFGGGWEYRQRHRMLDDGHIARGNLVDLAKALGYRFENPKNFQDGIRKIPQLLIGAGIAPSGDTDFLARAVEQALDDWKRQDIDFAIRDGQITL